MHYALPPKNPSSGTPAYIAQPGRRQLRPTAVLLTILGVLASLFLLTRLLPSSLSQTPLKSTPGAGGPSSANVVVVTVFDEKADAPIADFVRQNREDYARKHGYATFFPNVHDYELNHAPPSWAKVPALRHAMTLFPAATYIFHLDSHTLIMDSSLSVESHIMAKSKLEQMMITEVPIVPPDSIIKTFAGLKAEKVDFVLTQDRDGLSERSFILRRGEWAKFFLDAWFDPIYRMYNFQRAERHALEHIVQWHGTVLAKLALLPQNLMNSYHEKQASAATDNGIYKEGDFIINFGDCDQKERKCENEMRPYFSHPSQSQS